MKKTTKKLLCALAALAFAALLALPALAAPHPLLADEAGLLSAGEADALKEKLSALSAQWGNDIVIVTVDSTGGKTPREFADDYFDYNGYGQGAQRDGVLLLVSMAERDWYISTSGASITAFTDAGIEYLGGQLIMDGLSGGDYAQAFGKFADWCGKFFKKAAAGKPYDKNRLPKTGRDVLMLACFAFGGGCVIGGVKTKGLKNELKTVRKQQQAADYLRPGSLQVAYANEQLLFSNVTRELRQQASSSSSSSGGSRTHTSSSGRSHGGGGGKF